MTIAAVPPERLATPDFAGPGVAHAFTTRRAAPPWTDVLTAIGFAPGTPLHLVRQVHGAAVHVAGEGPPPDEPPTADAVLTRRAGVAVGVRTADCLPVLLADPEAGAVGAVHAGWRGLLAGVLGAAVAEILRLGATRSGLRAAFGPCIGVCCFEVGEEVAGPFGEFPGAVRRLPGVRPHVDLAAAARHDLARAGLRPAAAAGPCTACRTDLFHSWRAERARTGSLLSVVGRPQPTVSTP